VRNWRSSGSSNPGLVGTKNLEPEVALEPLEVLRAKGENALRDWLKEHTGRSASALTKALEEKTLASLDAARWQAACGNDAKAWARIRPFAGLVRLDPTGWPVLFSKGGLYVTEGTDRRSSGTHYTP